MAELVVVADVEAPADAVWRRLVDWQTHGAWMVSTEVEVTTGGPDGVGVGLHAVTSLGPFALRDPMTVTQWQPPPAQPARCVVSHDGAAVRGCGAFEVEALDAGRSRIIWSEWITPPFGVAGELGWLVVRPLLRWGLAASLRRLSRLLEAGDG